jgi:hypothetical protein
MSLHLPELRDEGAVLTAPGLQLLPLAPLTVATSCAGGPARVHLGSGDVTFPELPVLTPEQVKGQVRLAMAAAAPWLAAPHALPVDRAFPGLG